VAFDPLWRRKDGGFAPADFNEDGQDGFVTQEAPEVQVPTAGSPQEPEEVSEVEEEAEQAFDPASEGWVRIEDHEAALAEARQQAAAETEEALQEELGERIASLEEVVERLEQGVIEGRDAAREAILGASEDVATLVLELSRRVVGETLAVHPRALRKLVIDAMDRLPGDGPVKVRVRPEDLHVLQAHLTDRPNVTWIPDPELTSGCRVETDLGQVEASLEAAFAALEGAVAAWLEEQRI